VAANKFKGIRSATCHDTFSALQGVEDDDMNVLCLGARVIGVEAAAECIRSVLSARFSNAERHARRVAKIQAIEADARGGKFDVRRRADAGRNMPAARRDDRLARIKAAAARDRLATTASSNCTPSVTNTAAIDPSMMPRPWYDARDRKEHPDREPGDDRAHRNGCAEARKAL
jgi:hypothetical protein